jgi:hypothetical protein
LWAYAPSIVQPEEQIHTVMTLVLNGLEHK